MLVKGRKDAGAAIKRHFDVYPAREQYDPTLTSSTS